MESLFYLGYDDERFENAVDEDFHCAICMNVLKEPMMCQNNQHYFCKACITRHLNESKMCPTCREELSVETLRVPARILINYLSKLNIRCDNHERGCLGFVKLEDIKTHVLNCGFASVKCSNDGCSIEVNKRDRIYHETEVCEFRRVKCHDCAGMKKDCAEIKKDCAEMKKDCAETKTDCAEMKKEMEEVKKSVKKVKDNQEKMMKELRSLAEVKEMLAQMKVTSSVQGQYTSASHSTNTRDDIIVAGGERNCDDSPVGEELVSVELFSWLQKTWIPLKPVKQCRSSLMSFVYGNRMIVAGGKEVKLVRHSEQDFVYSIEEIFRDDMKQLILNDDQENQNWLSFPAKLPKDINSCPCVSFQDRLFLLGGRFKQEPSDAIYEVLLYPPYTSKLLSRLPQELCDHGAEQFNDDILIVGGQTESNACDSVVLYDVNRNVCKQMPPLPYAVSGMATVTYREFIILIGGRNGEGEVLNTVIVYNMRSGRSKMFPPMRNKRAESTAVVTGNIIVVMGGDAGEVQALNSVEYYSFDTNAWAELPPMKERRSCATSIVKKCMNT